MIQSRVLVNLAPLKAGGGQTVGLNFLQGIEVAMARHPDLRLDFLVAAGSHLSVSLRQCGKYTIYELASNPIVRVLQELTWISILCARRRYAVVYSCFGFAALLGNVKQIVGSADSNLYFPEVHFWRGLPLRSRIGRWFIDRYRELGLRAATAVVFENEELERRGRELFGLRRTRYIAPSVSTVVDRRFVNIPSWREKDMKYLLMLCGWQENKNILMLPEVLHRIKRADICGVRLVISVREDNSALCRRFKSALAHFGVADMVIYVGPIPRDDIAATYEACDIVLLLSKLESFSNNILEAWQFERPLLCADEPWSRNICQDAAAFCKREDAGEIASAIQRLLFDGDFVLQIVENGRFRLSKYPSVVARTQAELGYIDEIAKLS